MQRTEAGEARGESRLRFAAPAEDQAWNERHLSRPVRAPLIAAWSYRVPAVVLGCSERPDAAMNAAARAAGVALVERRSGGGAVLAGPWLLGVSVVLPPDHPLVVPSVTESYRYRTLNSCPCLHQLVNEWTHKGCQPRRQCDPSRSSNRPASRAASSPLRGRVAPVYGRMHPAGHRHPVPPATPSIRGATHDGRNTADPGTRGCGRRRDRALRSGRQERPPRLSRLRHRRPGAPGDLRGGRLPALAGLAADPRRARRLPRRAVRRPPYPCRARR